MIHLGARNITSIGPLDVLYELIAHHRVVVLKLNPTLDQLRPAYEAAFRGESYRRKSTVASLRRLVGINGDDGDPFRSRSLCGNVSALTGRKQSWP